MEQSAVKRQEISVQRLRAQIESVQLFDLEIYWRQQDQDTQPPQLVALLSLIFFDWSKFESAMKTVTPAFSLAQLCLSAAELFDDEQVRSYLFPEGQALTSGSQESHFKLLVTSVSSFCLALARLTDGANSIANPATSHLVLYFEQRLSLLFGMPNARNFEYTTCKDSQGLFFNYVLYECNSNRTKELAPKISDLIQRYRLCGHLFYLRFKLNTTNGDLRAAVGDCFTAQSLQWFSELKYRTSVFKGEPCPDSGILGLDRLNIPFPNLAAFGSDWVEEFLTAARGGSSITALKLSLPEKQKLLPILQAQLKHRSRLQFDRDDVGVVSPEDFLRTYVFFCPSAKVLDLELFFTLNNYQYVTPSNVPTRIFSAMDKLTAGWTDQPVASALQPHLSEVKRIWANYELGIAKIPRASKRVGLGRLSRDLEFVRLVWPQTKIYVAIKDDQSARFVESEFGHCRIQFIDFRNKSEVYSLLKEIGVDRNLRHKLYTLGDGYFF